MAIYENITREEYNELEGINASKLKHYYKSSLYGNYMAEKPRTETSAMAFGTLVHSAILEPELFNELYVIPKSEPINSKTGEVFGSGSKTYMNWKQENYPNQKLLNFEDNEKLSKIKDNINNDKEARFVLDNCPMRETAITWKDERTGLQCKALLDFIGDELAGDLKTIKDIKHNILKCDDNDNFKKWCYWEMFKMGYLIQFSFYSDGLKANNMDREFIVIFVKNCEDHDTAVVKLSEDTIIEGRYQYYQCLDNYSTRNNNTSAFQTWCEV